MTQYNFTWEITHYDANTGICKVVYTPTANNLTPITSSLKITKYDEIANNIAQMAPVYEWHREELNINSNNIIGQTGTGQKSI